MQKVLIIRKAAISRRLGFDPSRAEDGFKREDGRDATIVIDGVTVQRSTNNFTIDGITYNLTRDFEAVEGEVEAITLAMTQDVDQAFENIKTFVEAYNKVIETINEALSQERFRDYPPLTDEQKEAMTDKEIELWEEKARSASSKGILYSKTLSTAYAAHW